MMRKVMLVGVVALIGNVSAATAAEPSSSDRVLQDFGACRAMADPAQRLACFEKTFDGFEKAVKAKDVRILDRQDVRQARRSLFGFTLPRVELFGGDEKDAKEQADFNEINTTVASARPTGNGRVEIRLADESDAVWQTTDPMDFPPRPGDKIRIRKGVLGNYFLFTGGKSYRGTRLR